MNIELLHKTERHDGSMTENEKKEFRKSRTWLDHRARVAESQDMKDYVTGKTLDDNYNCHHVVMVNSEYTNLTNPFYALNKETHAKVHELFNRYFDDPEGWKEFKKKMPDDPRFDRLCEIIGKMIRLNDDIEPVLYSNRWEYTVVDSQDKAGNMVRAQKVKYPLNSTGYMQWNHVYIPVEYPEDTTAWVKYMCKINDNYTMGFVKEILELRHVNLYSSYKNFRNNPKIRIDTKRACRKELATTTELLRKYCV
jgi:hypothetical protein